MKNKSGHEVVRCEHCGQEVRVPTDAKLATANCPGCGAEVADLKTHAVTPAKKKQGKK